MVNALTLLRTALDVALAPLVPTYEGAPARYCLVRAPHLLGDLETGDLEKAIIAQSQDNGGTGTLYLGSGEWTGLVTVRCLSSVLATAEALRDAVPAAFATLSVPTYSITAAHVRPLVLPQEGGIHTAASIYRITISP